MRVTYEGDVVVPEPPSRVAMTSTTGVRMVKLSDLPVDVLSWMCDEWRIKVFELAGQEDTKHR